MSAGARCHDRRRRDPAVAAARLPARLRDRGGARRRRARRRLLRRAADPESVPPPAGGRRAQCRLRAAVAAPPAGGRRARRAPLQRGRARHARRRARRHRGAVRVFAPALVRCWRRASRPSPICYAVDFLRLATPYLAIAGLVAVVAAMLNADGRVGAGRLRPGRVQRRDDRRGCGRRARGTRQLAGGRRDPGGRDRGRRDLPAAGGRRRVFRLPDPPIAPQLSASPDVRRFFRMMLPGVIAAGIPQLKLIAGTIVASSSPSAVSWLYYAYRLYELPLGVVSIAIASVMTPAIAAHVRADDRAASRRRAIARVRDRARPRAAGGGRPRAAGRADRRRPVRARRVQRARHRGGRGGARRDCARHARPCAGEGARRGVVRARGHAHADAGGARRARGIGGRRRPAVSALRPCRRRGCDRGLRLGQRRPARRRAAAPPAGCMSSAGFWRRMALHRAGDGADGCSRSPACRRG